MRQRNLLHAESIAWILVAVCSVASQGQQDQIPKELALALIPFGCHGWRPRVVAMMSFSRRRAFHDD